MQLYLHQVGIESSCILPAFQQHDSSDRPGGDWMPLGKDNTVVLKRGSAFQVASFWPRRPMWFAVRTSGSAVVSQPRAVW